MKVTRGRVLIRIEDIETKEEGFDKIETVPDRYGIVVDLAEPFSQLGDPGYKVGSRVKVPESGGRYHNEGEDVFAVFLQSDIMMYEDPI